MKREIENTSNWIKNHCEKLGFDGYVIGLSGGIDSAVSMALAVKSMGADKVHGIILPCTRWGEKVRTEDMVDAQSLADVFGVKTITVKLDDSVNSIYSQIEGHVDIKSHLVSSNIKARLRMTTIRAYAESLHCLVLGTTNKTEEYLGYYTKAGDGGAGVDIEPIADFFKFEIFEMARQIDVDGKKIPEKIINRAPSAGLMNGQTDEGEIGHTYKDIDEYLVFRESVTKCIGVYDIYRNLGDSMKEISILKEVVLKTDVVDKVEKMIVAGQHKRVNPPSFIRS